MRSLTKTLLASIFLFSLTFSAGRAQDAQSVDTLMQRETILPAVLAWLQQQGSKLTYIGSEGGLKGYLVESPTGKMQSIYVTPDGKYFVAGLLIERGGKNVTGVQIGEMRKRFDDAAKSLDKKLSGEGVETSAKSNDASQIQAPDKGISSAPEEKTTETASAPKEPLPASPAANAAPSQPVSLPAAEGPVAGAKGNPSDVWLSKIDRDQFVNAASKLPFFEVGSRLAPVTLWMVADPKCPYCHATWDHIQDMVFAKKLKVRVILINALAGSEPFVREILASQSPARRYIESNAGRNIEPTVDPNSKSYVDSAGYMATNMNFSKEFNIDRTPFLAYTAEDGRFYSVLGLPSDLDAFLYASGATSK